MNNNQKCNTSQCIADARGASVTTSSALRALSMMDLTSLNESDTPTTIELLCTRAATPVGPVAAVCVYPRFVSQARRALADSDIAVATVVNFPTGGSDIMAVRADTEIALDAGAQEIDVVLPYRDWLAGRRHTALAMLETVCEASRNRARVKVILETGALADPTEIMSVSREAIRVGVDFLKTSTGKVETGATLEACAVMLEAIREQRDQTGRIVGLKPSGGVRSAVEAAQYLTLADAMMGADWATPETFRFGASSLLDSLLGTLGADSGNSSTDSY